MKIKTGYKVRTIAGENLVVSFGTLNVDMTRVVALNETALELWNRFAAAPFTLADVAAYLGAEYEIAPEKAAADAAAWVEALKKAELVDE